MLRNIFYLEIFRKEILTKKPSNAQKAQKRRAVNARLFYRKTATLVAEVQGILPCYLAITRAISKTLLE